MEIKKLLGICSARLVIDELQITYIAVHPKHQSQGLGKLLLKDLIKRSKSLQTKHIHLEVKETNKTADTFYKTMGFVIVCY